MSYFQGFRNVIDAVVNCNNNIIVPWVGHFYFLILGHYHFRGTIEKIYKHAE